MIYHGLNDKRLKTVTFPFEDGSHPTYYIPAEASDLINNSTVAGETVKEALETIDGKTLATLTQRSAKPGSIVTFEDGADDIPLRHLEFDIEAKQNLYGYDYPWPGGAGKNLLPISERQSTTNAGVTWTNNQDGSWTVNGTATSNSFPNGGTTMTSLGVLTGGDYTASLQLADGTLSSNVQSRIYKGSTSIGGTNNTTFTVPDGNTDTYYLTFRVPEGTTVSNEKIYPQFEVGSEITPYTPYENICPITEYTKANVIRTGKNLCLPLPPRSERGLVLSANGDGTFTLNGTFTGTSSVILSTSQPFVLEAGSYLLSGGGNSTYRLQLMNIVTKAIIKYSSGPDSLFTLTESAEVVVRLHVGYSSSMPSASNIVIKPMVRLATETDSTFEPFGNLYSVSFPSSAGAVCKGHVIIEKDGSGTLVVTHGVVDLGTLTLGYNSTNNYGYVNVPSKAFGNNNVIANAYKTSNASSTSGMQNGEIKGNATNSAIYIKDTRFTSAEEYQAGLNGVIAVYELATSRRYQLDPVQVKSLLGLNNIWTDTGDITDLTYYVGGEYKDAEDKRDIIEATIPYDTASGAIATFPDGADNVRLKELSVGVNPVQDLHGYDNPWPAGGGKNLADFVDRKGINDSGVVVDQSNRIATVNPIMIEDGVSYVLKTFGSVSSGALRGICAVYNGTTLVRRVTSIGANETIDTSDGDRFYFCIYCSSSTVSVTVDSAKAMVVKSTDTVTSYEPCSNICPISGYTEANVKRTGKNLCPTLNFTSGTGYTDYIDVNFENDRKYTFSCNVPNCRTIFHAYDKNKVYLARMSGITANTRVIKKSDFSYDVTGNMDDARYIRIQFYNAQTTADEINNGNVQVEIGSTATAYEPYQGTTYSIDLSSEVGTVYSGELDAPTGELIVNRAFYELTGQETWSSAGSGDTTYYYTSIGLEQFLYSTESICSHFAKENITTANTVSGFTVFFSKTGGTMRIVIRPFPSMSISNTEGMKAYLQEQYRNGTPVCVLAKYYEGKELHYTITPTEVTTLYGANSIWSDTNGDVSVNYPCDVGLFITKKLEELVGGNG